MKNSINQAFQWHRLPGGKLTTVAKNGFLHGKLVALILLAGLFGGWAPAQLWAQYALPPELAATAYADMIVVNGKIVSMDDGGLNQNPGNIYEAMAIKDRRVVALGTTEHIRTFADSDTTVIDLGGQTVIPGIIESHVHIFGDPEFAGRMGLRSPGNGVNVTVTAGRDLESTRLLVENAIQGTLPTGSRNHRQPESSPYLHPV